MRRETTLFILLLFTFFQLGLADNCDPNSLACNDQLNVALDANGTKTITPLMVVQGVIGTCALSVSPSSVSCADIGGSGVIYQVLYNATAICWGVITVKDENEPQFSSCPTTATIMCYEDNSPQAIASLIGSVQATDGCGAVSLSYTDILQSDGDCEASVLTRTWEAEDASSNFSTCIQTITIQVPTTTNVSWPSGQKTLICETYPTLPNGMPTPSATGEPQFQSCGQVVAAFEDSPIQTVGGGAISKFTRSWLVLNWCNPADMHSFNQGVKIINAPCLQGPGEEPFYADLPVQHEQKLIAYPNPAHDQLTIVFEDEFFYGRNLKLVNINGQVVQEQLIPVNTNSVQVNVKELPAGYYTVQLINGEEALSCKIIIN